MSTCNILVNPVATSAISTAQTSGVVAQASMAATQGKLNFLFQIVNVYM